jgi:cyclohexadieny/prephenate dehydrogenase
VVTDKKFKTVAIIGGGLIGSSLAHSIRENHLCDNLKIFDSNADVRKKLKEIFNSQEIYENLNETVTEADLVFLCIPVGSMRDVAKKISNLLKKGCILTDTGSTKNSVIKDIQPFIKEDVWFIPSHPLAGTENSGPGAGFPELFKDKYWVVVPYCSIPDEILEHFKNFLSGTGAIIETMKPE